MTPFHRCGGSQWCIPPIEKTRGHRWTSARGISSARCLPPTNIGYLIPGRAARCADKAPTPQIRDLGPAVRAGINRNADADRRRSAERPPVQSKTALCQFRPRRQSCKKFLPRGLRDPEHLAMCLESGPALSPRSAFSRRTVSARRSFVVDQTIPSQDLAGGGDASAGFGLAGVGKHQIQAVRVLDSCDDIIASSAPRSVIRT